MSEYQYYEFIALDRPLSESELASLRNVSSRAQLSPTRWQNVYNYGDFRGDVMQFMTRYFDAMVYVSNWSTHQFMLRFPRDLADEQALQACSSQYSMSVKLAEKFVVLNFCSQTEESLDWEQGEGWLTALAPLRADLMRGDQRAAYLGWLLGVHSGEIDEDAVEPPTPPGLRSLTAPLRSLVEFLRISVDLLAAAAERSSEETLSAAGIEDWIRALPENEKNRLLLELIEGKDPQLGNRLLRRFVSETSAGSESEPIKSRTVGQLLTRADELKEARKAEERRREAEARALREAEATAALAKRLDALAPRQEAAWSHVDQLVASGLSKAYDQAVDLLQDLQALAERENNLADFEARFADLRTRYGRKRAFWRRIRS